MARWHHVFHHLYYHHPLEYCSESMYYLSKQSNIEIAIDLVSKGREVKEGI